MNDDWAGWLVVPDSGPATASRVGGSVDLTQVRIQLTGRITVETANAKVDERSLYGSRARCVFVMLVVERGRPVPRYEFAEVLWPDGPPRTWAAALRGVVSKVRAFLTGAGLSESATAYDGFGAYQLHLPTDAVIDRELAGSAVEIAEQMLRESNVAQAITLAEYARGVALRPFLVDVKGRWADSVRDRLREVLLWAFCVLSEGYTQRGRYHHAIRAAEDAIALAPFRERAHQLLMRVHAAAGNPAEALCVYDRCRQLLANELGVYPTAETTALHLELLRNGN